MPGVRRTSDSGKTLNCAISESSRRRSPHAGTVLRTLSGALQKYPVYLLNGVFRSIGCGWSRAVFTTVIGRNPVSQGRVSGWQGSVSVRYEIKGGGIIAD